MMPKRPFRRTAKKSFSQSERDGDLELYSMDTNGKNVKRLTNEIGYDGGAFFSPDIKMIVYRASHPTTAEEIKRYKDLLATTSDRADDV